MTLRRDVVTLTAGVPFDDNLRIALANQYTRYPLVEPGTDRVVGYIHLKDIVSALASGKRPAFMRELVREPIYASDDTRLEWLRREFQRRRVHIAIVLGDNNRFVGLVTLEDLLEEIVGEIQDEYDWEEKPVETMRDGSLVVEGTLSAAELRANFDVPIPESTEFETVAGFLLEKLGSVPRGGEFVDVGTHRLTVVDVEKNRITKVKIDKTPVGAAVAKR
jgi:putative hemolysin